MDSNLNDIQLENDFDFNQEVLTDKNNNINLELESKWKIIEQQTEEKLKKIKEAERLNDLNDYSIMRINLKSLIHPVDETSDFEDFCKNKIMQLEKTKKSFENPSNYQYNLLTIESKKIGNANKNNNDLKTFLNIDKENEKKDGKYGRFNINNLIEMNKNSIKKKNSKLKNIFDIIDNNNDNNKSSIINNVNNFESKNIKRNNSGSQLVRKSNEKLMIKRPSFLNENYSIINNKFINYTQKNKNEYKKYKHFFGNNYIINNSYKTKRNVINPNEIGIKSKIEENYNYLYSLYPSLKRKIN